MKTETTARAGTALALQMPRADAIRVLTSSLYPGAKPESAELVLAYCEAAGLDPMQKPVHIVPMKVSTGEKDNRGFDIKADRDMIMPGIGLYRAQAARSGEYAGVSEPEFGPTKTLEFLDEVWSDGEGGRRQKSTKTATMEYPEWCTVRARRVVNGVVCEFPAREYWLENYATKGASDAPNAMWRKRPFGQIAKCAEAQALRKGFPEMTGSAPTFEELDGRELDIGAPSAAPPPAAAPTGPQLPAYPADRPNKEDIARLRKGIDKGKTPEERRARAKAGVDTLLTKYTLTDSQRGVIMALADDAPADDVTDVQAKPVKPQGAPAITYAQIADKLNAAETVEQLDDAIALTSALPAYQQAELGNLYNALKDQLQ